MTYETGTSLKELEQLPACNGQMTAKRREPSANPSQTMKLLYWSVGHTPAQVRSVGKDIELRLYDVIVPFAERGSSKKGTGLTGYMLGHIPDNLEYVTPVSVRFFKDRYIKN